MYDYFYGPDEGEQFSFIRVPKIFFENDAYKSMSADAKILYGFLLDRVSVSLKNGWKDDQNRVFIICTIEEIMEKLLPFTGSSQKSLFQLQPQDRFPHPASPPGDRSEQLPSAQAYVRRAEEFAKGLDAAEEISPGIKQEVFSGSLKTTDSDVAAIARASPDDRLELVENLRKPRAAARGQPRTEPADSDLEDEGEEPDEDTDEETEAYIPTKASIRQISAAMASDAEHANSNKASWVSFFQWLKGRGLDGVKLIVGDKCISLE